MAFQHIESIPKDKRIRVMRYRCPYCGGEAITKVEKPKSCSICTRRFQARKPEVINECWL
jgi:rubrerythrin